MAQPTCHACRHTAGTFVAPAKIRVPALPAGLVARPRLLDLVGRADPTGPAAPPVTFVCAPAGSGKTTLLANWARRTRRRGIGTVAWVTLDDGDDDLDALWSAILAAVAGGADRRAGSLHDVLSIGDSNGSSPTAAFLSAFTETVDGRAEPTFLVLDDVHRLRDPAALRSLDLLLRQPPAELRLALAGRFAPALPLPRLRLEGRLRDVDARQLGFTGPESAALLETLGVRPSPEAFAALLERTEGWVAGLRLAAMAMSLAADHSAAALRFTGDDRAVAAYLAGEVLDPLPEPEREVLRSTSVCERITAELAQELSGREDAGAVLDELERSNAFVTRSGRHGVWYRVHPLLRDHLSAELGRRDPGGAARFHRVTAVWSAAHGDTLDAIRHAAASGDARLTARLVAAGGIRHLLMGDGARLRESLATAGDEAAELPDVALVAAVAALEAGDRSGARAALARMRTEAPPSLPQRALGAVVRLLHARLGGDDATLTRLLAQPAVVTHDGDVDLLTLLQRGLTRAWLTGDAVAEADLREALRSARGSGYEWAAVQSTAMLALVACSRTELCDATRLGQEALSTAVAHGWTGTSAHATAALALGWTAYLRLDRDTAAAVEPATRPLAEAGDPGAALLAGLLGIALAFESGGPRRHTVTSLEDLMSRHRRTRLLPGLAGCAALVEQRIVLAAGDLRLAGEVTDRTRRQLGDGGEHRVLQAVHHVHRGRPDIARRLVAPVLVGDVPVASVTTLVDAWLWEARLVARGSDGQRAHVALLHALELAAPRRLLLPFVAAGPELRDLVAGDSGRFGALEPFADQVLAATEPTGREGLEPLTTRELELLTHLPSLLTTEEIAASLYVSVNTVKTHLRGIYRKLGVNSRREAITHARVHGLL